MVDHRRVQRTLFRMQLDPGFARAVRAGEPTACASTGLGPADLELVSSLDPAGVSADPESKRRLQVASNVALEYTLALGAAEREGRAAELVEGFLASPELHDAIAADGRLPLAFGAWLERRLDGDPARSVARLEHALARLRREAADDPPGSDRGDGAVHLSRRARLVELPDGTHAWCEALQARAADAPVPGPPAGYPPEDVETVLLFAPALGGPHRPAEVRTERLEPPVDELLRRARAGLSRAERAAFARAQGAAPEDLERFLASFLDEGVLARGPASA